MAKRRKTTKRRTSRRRSVGALKTSNLLVSIGGVLAGVAAAGYANKLLFDKVADEKKKTMYTSIMPIAVGIALPMFVKSELGKFAGAGMIAVGASKFLASAGLGATEDDMSVTISGDDLSVIAGDDNFAMAGDDDNFAMAGEYGDSGISVLAGTDDSDLIQMSAFDEEEA